MSTGTILPVAKSLYLCDGHLGFTSKKTDLMGTFDSIRPQGGHPYIHPSFVVFARLAQGLGTIPFRVDVRLAADGQFVAGTFVQQLVFSDRANARAREMPDSLVAPVVLGAGCRSWRGTPAGISAQEQRFVGEEGTSW